MSRPLGPSAIRIVPLGGLGEIGMNCLAIEQEDGILVVDCGTSFPHDDVGVDVVHPDFGWLAAHADRVKGVFLTHGHEDHIGAIPYLADELKVPIWGPPHAIALVKRRLAEHGFGDGDVRLIEARPHHQYSVGSFSVEPIRVAHSIVEATALAIRTRAGLVIHTGDFNFDPDPPDGEPSDEDRLCALGDEGVALLMSDSTNIDVPVRAGSERSVARALERLVLAANRRVFIAMFASNIQRLNMVGQIAQRTGRRLCLLGRSLVNQVEIAHEIGRLHWPSSLRVAPEHARDLPRDRLLVVAGGSQAEPNSAMQRLSKGAHNHLTIDPEDTIIMSSRVIPGNERHVIDMICDLLRLGAQITTRHHEPEVHTSGHGGRSEQEHMLDLVRPRAFLPVHGTLHHLRRHADLARERGVDDVLVTENGTSVVLGPSEFRLAEAIPSGKIHVAVGGERLTRETLQKRAELGRAGVVTVSLAVSSSRGMVAGPNVHALGIPLVDQEPGAVRGIAREVVRTYEHGRKAKLAEPLLIDDLRRAARRAVYELCGYRPVVEVSLLKVDP